MAKLQYVSWVTILAVFGLNTINISDAHASVISNQQKTISVPDKAISLVRQEYTEDKYSIPAEFKADIPGIGVYQKYAEYLPDL